MKTETHKQLSEAEKQQVLFDFNRNETAYPKDQSIAQVFEAQVLLTPDNVALVYEDETLTYHELNQKANQLARVLLDYEIQPEEIVGILCERSLELLIGILAILKAGGAYLPLDSDYPEERILYMMEDAGATKILYQSLEPDYLPPTIWPIAIADNINPNDDDSNPELSKSGTDLAYVMYTSGSTGQPKGVLIEQQSVLRLVKNTNYIEISANDRLFQTGALTFDASTFDIWAALLNGATLYLAPTEKMLDALQLSILFEKYQITTCWFTSSFFNHLLETDIELFKGLRHLLIGGDRLSPYHVQKVREKYPELKLINGYGPTENTTFTTCYQIESIGNGEIPIGKPIANTQVYILDEQNQLLPIGESGEICIAGDGLARGYLNAPELNATKFVANPFQNGQKMYRTGDLGSWDEEGNIHFLGRNDQQVKIRGFRVEPGEIENRLLAIPELSESVVQAEKDEQGLNFLTAYYVAKEAITASEIRKILSLELPAHLIPSYFIEIEQIPLTANGKVDRGALPKYDGIALIENTSQDSGSDTEERLREIWQKILSIKQIGIHDDFFEIGGHSLKALQIAISIRQQFAIDFNSKEIFASPTIYQLAQKINGLAGVKQQVIEVLEKRDHYDLSFAQQRLWLMSKIGSGKQAFNVPFTLLVTGNLDLHLLEKAMQLLVNRHESMRTYFEEVNHLPVQKIVPSLNFSLTIEEPTENLSSEQLDEWIEAESATSARQLFDLSKAPLWSMKILAVSKSKHYLLMNFHHIISDGWSMNIFSEDLLEAYKQLKENPAYVLPELEIQYKDYAHWQNKLLEADGELSLYWKSKFSNKPSVIDLPDARLRPETKTFNGASLRFQFNIETTLALKKIAKELKVTDFAIIRTLLNLWIYQKTAQEDIIVGTPTAGRNHNQILEVFGYFINTLPLRDHLNWNDTIRDTILQISQNTMEAIQHEDYPVDKILQDIAYQRDPSRSPLFDLGLSWQNFDEVQKDESLSEISIGWLPTTFNFAKYDLWLLGNESGDHFGFLWEYNTDLFDEDTIKKYALEFSTLAQSLPEILDKKLIALRDTNRNFAPGEDNSQTTNDSFEFNF